MPTRAIFLDRDGVICVNRTDYVKTWDEFIFLPRVFDALARLAASDFRVVIATNQSGVNRGNMTQTALDDIHARMQSEIRARGGRIDALYFCPHAPEENCECRKPRTQMYRRAAEKFAMDFARSYVIGDAVEDVQAAQALGARAILVLTGRGAEHNGKLLDAGNSDFHAATDLLDAVEWIEAREGLKRNAK
ncbi:MAG: D-glycero-beta-D-manno-heptose 1,7-bisphosphate 7-phosphatase [Chloroflexi bacterium]|nr:D-glycero-beta-D-manno-heptose 1,7-bisphosphate 7-phosphatase [Chloroflexota bacterium]